ncbi:MAG TPA: PDZ domain-containing protein, partial [Patescibacteria group bacterium]|nr:PDZ domain-containing protein [Patescibacteria group bacterium]
NGTTALKISYSYYGNERTVRTPHVNRFHASIFPVACMFYVDGRQDEIHHVILHHDSNEWKEVSTALSPVNSFKNGGKVILGALNYDILADSPIEIGNQQVRTFEHLGAKHEVALVSQTSFDVDWLTEQTKEIVRVEAHFFGGLPYDRYVFIVHVVPNLYGGLEHARSSVNMVDVGAFSDKTKAIQLLSLLCHEYFHTWNVKRIRPRELGPFDYTRENYTRMLWLAEGFTSYYDDLLTYRCGFYTRDEYLKNIAKDHLGKLARVPGRKAMSVKDSSQLAWVKLYLPTPDSGNRFPSYYLKGGVIAMLLDFYIIEKSGGAKTLDDAVRAMWDLYLKRPELGLTEDEVIDITEKSTGVAVREFFLKMLDGRDELPYEEAFKNFGLVVKEKQVKKETEKFGEKRTFLKPSENFFTGLTLKDGAALTVAAVEANSPAEQAGIGVDDEIIAVNGIRVTNVRMFEETLAWNSQNAEITAAAEGKLYSAALKPIFKTEFEITVDPNATVEQKQLLDIWLKRG